MKLKECVKDAQKIMIAGHVAPDGDCVGSAIAVYRYLKKHCPEKEVIAYLESLPEVYEFLDPDRTIITNVVPTEAQDLFIVVDASSHDRLGDALSCFKEAKSTIVVDHHVSNIGYGKVNIIEPDASSACEVIAKLMDEKEIDKDIAEALYTGMITDSGGFRYESVCRETMEIAGMLMSKGIDHSWISDRCLSGRTYIQAQLLGRALLESMLMMDGKCIITTVTQNMLSLYGAKEEDTEGIVEQLRVTRGVEVAVFIRETGDQQYKVSLRSNRYADVSKIATYYEGGGHKKAAGFSMRGDLHDVINNIMNQISLQIQ